MKKELKNKQSKQTHPLRPPVPPKKTGPQTPKLKKTNPVWRWQLFNYGPNPFFE